MQVDAHHDVALLHDALAVFARRLVESEVVVVRVPEQLEAGAGEDAARFVDAAFPGPELLDMARLTRSESSPAITRCLTSSSVAVVVIQHAAEAFAALNVADSPCVTVVGAAMTTIGNIGVKAVVPIGVPTPDTPS